MIELNNISRYFFRGKPQEIRALSDISLTFPSKGLIAVSGKSGSGKSTLLNVIGCLDKADGRLVIDGFTPSGHPSAAVDAFRRRHIGYIFQDYMLFPELTVADNIDISLGLIGMADSDKRQRLVFQALEAVGMQRYALRQAKDLSGGQKQRVAIARTLAASPDIILCDEPTGNLDSDNSEAVMNILARLAADRLVIVVTHNMTLAKEYAERIIGLEDGKIISDKTNTPAFKNDAAEKNITDLGPASMTSLSDRAAFLFPAGKALKSFFRMRKTRKSRLAVFLSFCFYAFIAIMSLVVSTSAGHVDTAGYRENSRIDTISVYDSSYMNGALPAADYSSAVEKLYYDAYAQRDASAIYDIDSNLKGYAGNFSAYTDDMNGSGNSSTAATKAFSLYSTDLRKSYDIIAGRLPTASDEIAIDIKTLETLNSTQASAPYAPEDIVGTYYSGSFNPYVAFSQSDIYVTDGYRFKITGVISTGDKVAVVNGTAYEEALLHGYRDYGFLCRQDISPYSALPSGTEIHAVNDYDSTKTNLLLSLRSFEHISAGMYETKTVAGPINIVGIYDDEAFPACYASADDETRYSSSGSVFPVASARSLIMAADPTLSLSSGRLPAGYAEIAVPDTISSADAADLSASGYDIVGYFTPHSLQESLTIYSDSYYAHTNRALSEKSSAEKAIDGFIGFPSLYDFDLISYDKTKTAAFIESQEAMSRPDIKEADRYQDYVDAALAGNMKSQLSGIVFYSIAGVLAALLLFISTRGEMVRHIANISVMRLLGTSRSSLAFAFGVRKLLSGLLSVIVSFGAVYLAAAVIASQGTAVVFPAWYIVLAVVLALLLLDLLAVLLGLMKMLVSSPQDLKNEYDV